MLRIFSLPVLFLLFVCLPASAGAIHLVYSANRQGEVDPCDCQGGQAGGLSRWVGAVRAVPSPKLVVESGDVFFTRTDISAQRRAEELNKAELIAWAYARAGVQAFLPGERDLALGESVFQTLLKATNATAIACNLSTKEGRAIGVPGKIFAISGKKIAITGIAAPEFYSSLDWVTVAPPEESLKHCVESLRAEKPDFIFVLSHAGLKQDRQLAAAVPVDGFFGAHSIDPLNEPALVGTVRLMQTDFRGAQVGTLQPITGKHQLISLTDDRVRDSETDEHIASHRKKTRDRAVAENPISSAEHPRRFVANASTCQGCHPAQTKFWEQTKHASAYLVLFAKNQHFDAECIACHSLGFRAPEGFEKIARPVEFADPSKTVSKIWIEDLMHHVFAQEKKSKGEKMKPLDSRKEPARYARLRKRYLERVHEWESKPDFRHLFVGVQCEHCHGNRHGHPGQPVPKTNIQPAICTQCHQPPNHVGFDFAASLPTVSCPKLGTAP